jgi:hypothetical protein
MRIIELFTAYRLQQSAAGLSPAPPLQDKYSTDPSHNVPARRMPAVWYLEVTVRLTCLGVAAQGDVFATLHKSKTSI